MENLIFFFSENAGDVIVTTPQSLLRLLTDQSLLFLRLCHLVLDEVEVLFSEANEQVGHAKGCSPERSAGSGRCPVGSKAANPSPLPLVTSVMERMCIWNFFPTVKVLTEKQFFTRRFF